MNTAEYLRRIGITETPKPTRESLRLLQWAHLTHVPYENLDILDGVPIRLDEASLYEKIVIRRRGGYCFELNELFGRLLRALGYEVTDLFARFLSDGLTIPKRRHHVLLVRAPGDDTRYLCDVGVGIPSPNAPLRLELDAPQGEWRLRKCDFLGWIVQRRKGRAWFDYYSVTEEAQIPEDYAAISFFCEKSPDSPFNKSPMLALRTPGGRLTRDGNAFRRFEGDNVTEIRPSAPEEREKLTFSWFGIDWKERASR